MIEEIVLANLARSPRWSGLCKTEITSLVSGFHVITGTYKEPEGDASGLFYIVPIMASTLVAPHDLINETKNVSSGVGKSDADYSIVIAVVEVDSSITYLKVKEGINTTI